MDKKKLWNILKVFLQFSITAVLLYLVFSKIDKDKLKELFLNSDLSYVFFAFLFYVISLFTGCWRNLSFLKSIGLNLTYGFNLRLYFLGLFYNVTLPGGVGGDGYKIYILRKKYQLPTKRIFLAMLFDRLSGLWAIGVITVTLIILIPQIDIHPMWPVIALLSGTGIYYYIMNRYFPDYSKVFADTHLKAIGVQSLQVFTVIFLLLSQNFTGKFSPYLFSFLLSTLAANLPISFMGLGTREGAMFWAIKEFGLNYNLAIFLTTSFFFIGLLTSLSGLYFVYNSKEFAPAPKTDEAENFEKEADASIEAD